MSQGGLYMPRIADDNIRRLYRAAKRLNMPMTALLDFIVYVALEDLDDYKPEEDSLDEGKGGGIFTARVAAHDKPRRLRRKNHDRPTTRHFAHVRECKKRRRVYVQGGNV